jgi:hypothetical protein
MREEWLIPSHIPELPTDLLQRLGDARKEEMLDDLERWQAWAKGGWKVRSLAQPNRYVRSAPFKVQSRATRNDALDISQIVGKMVYMVEAIGTGVFPPCSDPLTIKGWIPKTNKPPLTNYAEQHAWALTKTR